MGDREPVRRARLSEAEGCALLKVRFQGAGYAIQEHVRFQEGEVDVVLDGYDPAARVGYEYLTTEAGDREEFTPAVLGALHGLVQRGEVYLFLIDELEVDAPGLSLAAERFLSYVKRLQQGEA